MDNTEQIKTLIYTSQVSEARKELLVNAYDYYVQFKSLSWIKPRFTREDKPIFLPLESEIDALINNCGLKLSIFLQFLKETGVDSGEAWKTEWKDIDVLRKTVNIHPTKNHNARTLPISDNLISRMYRLPRTNDRVFANKRLDHFRTSYDSVKLHLAEKLNNPE